MTNLCGVIYIDNLTATSGTKTKVALLFLKLGARLWSWFPLHCYEGPVQFRVR